MRDNQLEKSQFFSSKFVRKSQVNIIYHTQLKLKLTQPVAAV